MQAARIQAILDGIPDAVTLEKLAADGEFKAIVIALIELAAVASAFMRWKLERELADATAVEALQRAEKPAGR